VIKWKASEWKEINVELKSCHMHKCSRIKFMFHLQCMWRNQEDIKECLQCKFHYHYKKRIWNDEKCGENFFLFKWIWVKEKKCNLILLLLWGEKNSNYKVIKKFLCVIK